MISMDRDALICDLAEYYHVYDLRKLPPETVAVLACGLPQESRIMKILSGITYDMQQLMMASILDYLATLTWFQTKDGHKNRNRPKSYVEMLTGKKKEEKEEVSFRSPEEFERERQRILQRLQEDELRTCKRICTDSAIGEGNQGKPGAGAGNRSGRRRKKRRKPVREQLRKCHEDGGQSDGNDAGCRSGSDGGVHEIVRGSRNELRQFNESGGSDDGKDHGGAGK